MGVGVGESGGITDLVYRDVRKIWSGFFDLDNKYGRGILAKNINTSVKIVIFKLKNIDLLAKFG